MRGRCKAGREKSRPLHQCDVFSVGLLQLASLVLSQPPQPPHPADFLAEGKIQLRVRKITAASTQTPTIISCHIKISPLSG